MISYTVLGTNGYVQVPYADIEDGGASPTLKPGGYRRVCFQWLGTFLGVLAATAILLHFIEFGWAPLYHRPPVVEGLTVPVSPWPGRADHVKLAFIRAYSAYEEAAFPHDELCPVSNLAADNLNGWGLTNIDSLDTMYIMGLHDLFNRSVAHVANLTFNDDEPIPFFETTIRYLGGLLSAYALSGEPIFLARADDLGQKLLEAFDTPSGLPGYSVNFATGAIGKGTWTEDLLLAEIGSCQLEFRYLAHLTGRPAYIAVVDHVTNHLRHLNGTDGLYSLYFQDDGAPSSNQYSAGAIGDSTYEYFLKEWLQTGRTEPKLLDMYLRSAEGIIDNMLYVSPNRRLLYATPVSGDTKPYAPTHTFGHLTCFLAGVLALGAVRVPGLGADPRHAWAAEGLAHTCWVMYADSRTGVAPDSIVFPDGGTRWAAEIASWNASGSLEGVPPGVTGAVPLRPVLDMNDTAFGESVMLRDYNTTYPGFPLRPETIESFYILWRTTGDVKWRERGWEAYEALEKAARTDRAYATIKDVDAEVVSHEDDMPSFFLAETLKYAYLLFTDEDLIPLDKWVFNTEAHPLPVFEWRDWEATLYNLNPDT